MFAAKLKDKITSVDGTLNVDQISNQNINSLYKDKDNDSRESKDYLNTRQDSDIKRFNNHHQQTLQESKEKQKLEHHRVHSIQKIPIYERIALQRQRNALQNWEQRNREWEKFTEKLSKKLGKTKEKLVMVNSVEFREQAEEYDVIQKAIPCHQRHGNGYWLLRLRGEGTRYVPIGNIFSGLFCPVKEFSNRKTEVIRRPSKAISSSSTTTSEHGKTWRNSHALLARKNQLKRTLKDIRPHEISKEESSGLQVIGINLFEWIATSSEEYYNKKDLNIKNIEEEEQDDKKEEELRNKKDINSSIKDIKDSLKGPQLVLTTDDTIESIEKRIIFHSVVNEKHYIEIIAKNIGTTVLYYNWRQKKERNVLGTNSHHNHQCFLLYNSSGIILPKTSLIFKFLFHSTIPGMFMESWILETIPNLLNSKENLIELKGIAIESDKLLRKRMIIETNLNRRVIETNIKKMIFNIINSIQSYDKIDSNEIIRKKNFLLSNSQYILHYSEQIYNKFSNIAFKCFDLLQLNKDNCLWKGNLLELKSLVEASSKVFNQQNSKDSNVYITEDQEELDELEEQEEQDLEKEDNELLLEPILFPKDISSEFQFVLTESSIRPYNSQETYNRMFNLLTQVIEEIPLIEMESRGEFNISMETKINLYSPIPSSFTEAKSDQLEILFYRRIHNTIKKTFSHAIQEFVNKTYSEENQSQQEREFTIKSLLSKPSICSLKNLENYNLILFMNLTMENKEEINDLINTLNQTKQLNPNSIVVILSFFKKKEQEIQETIEEKSENLNKILNFTEQEIKNKKNSIELMINELSFKLEDKVKVLNYISKKEEIKGIYLLDMNEPFCSNDSNTIEDKESSLIEEEMNLEITLESLFLDSKNLFVLDTFLPFEEEEKRNQLERLYKIFNYRVFSNQLNQKFDKIKQVLEDIKTSFSSTSSSLCAIISGRCLAKKLSLIDSLLDRVDEIFFGGEIAFSFMRLQGLSIGDSYLDVIAIPLIENLKKKAERRGVKLHFPVDYIIGDHIPNRSSLNTYTGEEEDEEEEEEEDKEDDKVDDKGDEEEQYEKQDKKKEDQERIEKKEKINYCRYEGNLLNISINEGIPKGWIGLDIGEKSTKLMINMIRNHSSVIIAGTLGMVEYKEFQKSTQAILQEIESFNNTNTKILPIGITTNLWFNRIADIKVQKFYQLKDSESISYIKKILQGSNLSELDNISNKEDLPKELINSLI